MRRNHTLTQNRKGYKHQLTTGANRNVVKMPIARRRSVTIDKFVWEAINDLRASGLKSGYDFDFTTVLNLVAEYGIVKMLERPTAEEKLDPKLFEVFEKYSNYSELRESGLLDDWKDLQEFKEWKQSQQNTKPIIKPIIEEKK